MIVVHWKLVLNSSSIDKLILKMLDHLSVNLKQVQTGKVQMAPVSYNLGNQVFKRPEGLTAANRECLMGRTCGSIKYHRRQWDSTMKSTELRFKITCCADGTWRRLGLGV